ncbi:N-lysine methyltransferase SMYD2-like [Paramacrobiotus metropolitanus]|uniref:N-lysine methyltransferase SMYD2-like n=1 Tax=Paramacrobiotus metropolitanus TaxID=2943436 RepID=UPI0024464650|nr:N-lysine methyltransferase SMYD2-like [Paramacrobiotus metropolitanus]
MPDLKAVVTEYFLLIEDSSDIVKMEAKNAAPSVSSRSIFAGGLVMSCDPMVWMLERSVYKRLCAYCLQESLELRTCSGCQMHRYCSGACQLADWKVEHKLECAMMKEMSVHLNELMDELTGEPAVSGPSGRVHSSRRPDVPFAAVFFCLSAKLLNKTKKNAVMDIPGLGSKSVADLVLIFTGNASQPDDEVSMQQEFLKHNGLDLYDMLAPRLPIGRAVYPQALRARMTPVSWDINVVLNRRGRMLLMHAVEDIPLFNGLQDLRFNDMGDPFRLTRVERRAEFERRYGHPCSCRKCTEAYVRYPTNLREYPKLVIPNLHRNV